MTYSENGFNGYSTVDMENIDIFIKKREKELLLELKKRIKGPQKPPTKGIFSTSKKSTKSK